MLDTFALFVPHNAPSYTHSLICVCVIFQDLAAEDQAGQEEEYIVDETGARKRHKLNDQVRVCTCACVGVAVYVYVCACACVGVPVCAAFC